MTPHRPLSSDGPVDSTRSRIMRAVGRANTGPELTVRRLLHGLGLRFRLHQRNLPGRPDIVLAKHRTVVFVHGCFWHRHAGCPKATMPKMRFEFWREKFDRNVARDQGIEQTLVGAGWRVLTIWECETGRPEALKEQLRVLFGLNRQEKGS